LSQTFFTLFRQSPEIEARTIPSVPFSPISSIGRGSTSLVTDAGGNKVSEMRYEPWGETRYENGVTPTDYRYTGQREEEGIGLYYYGARWYDQDLGRFAQADTVLTG
jgi:RHS repeat-associated protein